MSDQERGRVYPSTDQDCDENRPMQSRAMMDYDYIPQLSDQESLWHQNAPISSDFCREEAHEASHYYDMLDDLSMFEIPSPLPQGVGPSETPCLEDVIVTEKEQSSGTKEGHASDFLEKQTKRDLQEGGVKEDSDTNGQSKQQKRIRCPEVHNQNERVRRQKLKEKMKALRELIPDCNSRDKLSTLDEAIKYIKTLQYQLQMMSMGAGYSASHSPFMMMAQPPIQNGLQIPYNILPPFPQTGPPHMLPPLDFPRNHPYFLPSSATSRPPASGGIHPRNFVQQTTQANPSSQHPIYEQCCTRGESTRRVLPSRVDLLPQPSRELMDCGGSHSTSSEWSSSSTTK